jgi:hypothetical protein
MADDIAKNLGPLKHFVGRWEGERGEDTAPSSSRAKALSKYRETVTFSYIGLVDNHEQRMHGLRYLMTAWKLGEPNPFHEDQGYLLWDSKRQEVYKCFVIPRGITVLAGGKAGADAKEIKLFAEAGSQTFGISSNPFLIDEFKTVKFEYSANFPDAKTLVYEQDTVMQVKGQKELFHHVDKNTLKKVE